MIFRSGLTWPLTLTHTTFDPNPVRWSNETWNNIFWPCDLWPMTLTLRVNFGVIHVNVLTKFHGPELNNFFSIDLFSSTLHRRTDRRWRMGTGGLNDVRGQPLMIWGRARRKSRKSRRPFSREKINLKRPSPGKNKSQRPSPRKNKSQKTLLRKRNSKGLPGKKISKCLLQEKKSQEAFSRKKWTDLQSTVNWLDVPFKFHPSSIQVPFWCHLKPMMSIYSCH